MEEEEDDEYLVSCRCESAKAVSTLLSCLKHIASGGEAEVPSTQSARHNKRSSSHALQPVTVFCSATSLNFHVYGKAKQMQASVDMPSSLFSDYDVCSTKPSGGNNAVEDDNDEEEAWRAGGEFCVNLTTVLECLHVLGSHHLDKTKLFFSYNISKDIFKMELLEQDSGALCTAAIPGMLPPEDDLSNSLALAFRSSPIAARIIVKSDALWAVMSELDAVQGGTEATVSLSSHGGLEMNVVGSWGECRIILPAKGNHVVSIEFPSQTTTAMAELVPPPPQWKYPLHAITESMRGLDIASETCITMNTAGMMAIQHQVCDQTLSDNTPSFIDFILCCLQNDEDDSDDDEQNTVASSRATPRQSSWLSQQTQDGAETTAASIASSRVVTNKKTVVHGQNGAADDDSVDGHDDDDGSSRYPTSSAASDTRLFGSVVAEAAVDANSSVASSSHRNVRRRRRRDTSRHRRPQAGSDNGDDDEEEDEPPLDVTALASPPRPRRRGDHQREDDCSSPELLYGQQH